FTSRSQGMITSEETTGQILPGRWRRLDLGCQQTQPSTGLQGVGPPMARAPPSRVPRQARHYGTGMATLNDVARVACAPPEVAQGEAKHGHGHRTWTIGGKAFAWERPFSKADLKRFGEQTPPQGPILAVRTADLHDKEAVLAANPDAIFTIPHFDGYSAVV